MKPGGSTALAVGVGYVLGRRHKLRAALMLGAAAASGRLAARGAGGGGQQGGGQQGGGQQPGGSGGGLVGKLTGAGRSVAMTAVARSADRIGERLNEAAASLRQGGSSGGSGGSGGSGSSGSSGEEDK
jgi:hypothetical protein